MALVSCVKAKRTSAARAKDLYTSPFFRALRAYAEAHADTWYVLSAKYGLLDSEQVVDPYELTLNTMPKRQRVAWAERVQDQLLKVLPKGAEVIVLAGSRYRADLVPWLEGRGFSVKVPLKGLRIGEQLHKLARY